jgi:hypothetical protein
LANPEQSDQKIWLSPRRHDRRVARTWTEDEVEDWLAEQPVVNPARPRGIAEDDDDPNGRDARKALSPPTAAQQPQQAQQAPPKRGRGRPRKVTHGDCGAPATA